MLRSINDKNKRKTKTPSTDGTKLDWPPVLTTILKPVHNQSCLDKSSYRRSWIESKIFFYKVMHVQTKPTICFWEPKKFLVRTCVCFFVRNLATSTTKFALCPLDCKRPNYWRILVWTFFTFPFLLFLHR